MWLCTEMGLIPKMQFFYFTKRKSQVSKARVLRCSGKIFSNSYCSNLLKQFDKQSELHLLIKDIGYQRSIKLRPLLEGPLIFQTKLITDF